MPQKYPSFSFNNDAWKHGLADKIKQGVPPGRDIR